MKRSLASIGVLLAILLIAYKAFNSEATGSFSSNTLNSTTHKLSRAQTTSSTSNSWLGVVTYVVDGDTLRIKPLDMPTNTEPRKIRISGIDAPETCQSYGSQSTAALKLLVASKTVTVQSTRIDEYGRDVAKITIKDIDAGAWMVKNGHAWSYHYRHSAGPYRVEEEAATRARLGLFADNAAIEPRVFRLEHGTCHVPKVTSATVSSENLRRHDN